ncbi:MAG: FMN-binding protein [Clostridiales bacterium]|nr:FMN-binding protein [Clostridiales bacterium]
MKKLLSLVQLLPAVAVGLAAAIGFQLSAPALEAIVWPEEPDLSAVAEDSEALDEQETEAVAEELLAQGIGDFEDGVYYGSGTGFSGITQVEVVVENRQIVQINILSYQDDDTFFNRARGVIDAVLTAQTWEVDTVSGATYSSRGILEAVKNALSGTNELSETADTGTTATELSVTSYDDSAVWADGTYTGSARGFGGIIKVQVTIKDGKITSIQVLSHSGETASYFNKAKAIISRILKAQSPNVDTVSGATYSSTGIREAVKAALKKAAGQASSASSADEDKTVDTGTTATELSVTSYDDSAVWADGTYTGSARGFGGIIKVQVTIKDGKITSIQVLSHSGETASYFNKAKAIISRILKAQSPNVDTVSGATYSSTGIREAVKAALKKAAGQASSASSADEDEDVEEAAEQTVSAASQEVTLPEGAPADGSYTGTGECAKFGYSVTLTAVFQNGELTALKDFALVDNDDADNEPFAASSWKGMKTNLLSGSTDVVSGATYSSNAILAAYQDAYTQAVAAGGGTVETPGESDDSDETQNSDPDEDEAQDEQDATEDTGSGSDLTGVPADGTYTASALCEPDEYEDFEAYTLTADVTFADGKLVSIDNLTSTDDSNVKYYTRAAQGTSKYTGVVAQLIDKQSGADIDAVSNATCSSVALVALYENAYAQAVAANTGETEAEEPESEEEEESEEASEEEPAEEEASPEDGEAAEAESTDGSTEEQEAEQTESAERETVTAASTEEQAAEEQAAEEQAAEEETEEPASGDEQETEPASEETPQQNEQEDGSE